MLELMTIGYEGLTLDQFFCLLHLGTVETVIDVRELPISRKPGFSKSALSTTIASHGLNYVHVASLGCPRHIRNAYRVDKDWTQYTQKFNDYIHTQDKAIEELVERVQKSRCCLLCFEANPKFCHRSLITEKVAFSFGQTISVNHLLATSLAATVNVLQAA